MPTKSSQTDRLREAEQAARAKMEASRRALAAIQAQQRAEAKKAHNQRRYQIGTLADDAGLLSLDDAVLRRLFTMLAGVTRTPDPGALLDSLLQDVGGQPGRSVDAYGETVSRAATA